jgi:hypothetical protein
MKKLTTIAGLMFAVAALFTSTASAGTKVSSTVYVNASSHMASGSVGSARNSADGNQYIGCILYGNSGDNPAAPSGACYARDAAGIGYSCSFSYKAEFATLLTAATANSFYEFIGDANGNCVTLFVENFSYFAPATP